MKTWLPLSMIAAMFCAGSLDAGDPRTDAGVWDYQGSVPTISGLAQEELVWPPDQAARPSIPVVPAGTMLDAPGPALGSPLPAGPSSPAPKPASAAAPNHQDEYYTLDELKSEMKKLVWTKGDFKIVPYGILWGNMVYETQRTNVGDYVLYVWPERARANEQFHLDGRSTRLGIDITGPQVSALACAPSGGKVEIDFQRNFDTENRAGVLLRHAYVEVKNDEFRLLAGQTWDLISPLFPGTLMYSVGWSGGNIGYRRAQFRGERYLALSDVSLVTLQGSLNTDLVGISEVGGSSASFSGDHAGWPVIMGRIATKLGPRGEGYYPIEFGVSSHVGEQVFDFRAPMPPQIGAPRRTWSLNVDARMPLGPRFGVQGELFAGENLATFFGGILQGVDVGSASVPGTGEPIRSRGGWFDVWYDWTPTLHSHVGYSIDDPIDEDITVGRTYNAFLFANLSYDLTQKFLVGVEISSWKTLWKNQPDGDSVHCDFVAKYNF